MNRSRRGRETRGRRTSSGSTRASPRVQEAHPGGGRWCRRMLRRRFESVGSRQRSDRTLLLMHVTGQPPPACRRQVAGDGLHQTSPRRRAGSCLAGARASRFVSPPARPPSSAKADTASHPCSPRSVGRWPAEVPVGELEGLHARAPAGARRPDRPLPRRACGHDPGLVDGNDVVGRPPTAAPGDPQHRADRDGADDLARIRHRRVNPDVERSVGHNGPPRREQHPSRCCPTTTVVEPAQDNFPHPLPCCTTPRCAATSRSVSLVFLGFDGQI